MTDRALAPDRSVETAEHIYKASSLASVISLLFSIPAQWSAEPPYLRYPWVAVSLASSLYFFHAWTKVARELLARNSIRLITQKWVRITAPLLGREIYDICTLRDEGLVNELDRLDSVYYQDARLPDGVLCKWWGRYRDGLLAAFDGQSQLVGAVGFWPIKQTTYKELRRARRTEGEIAVQSIDPSLQGDRSYWYVSGVMVRQGFRQTILLHQLLNSALIAWSEAVAHMREVNIISIATSQEGARLLIKFGFRALSVRGGTDQYTRYIIENIDPRDLKRQFASALRSVAKSD